MCDIVHNFSENELVDFWEIPATTLAAEAIQSMAVSHKMTIVVTPSL